MSIQTEGLTVWKRKLLQDITRPSFRTLWEHKKESEFSERRKTKTQRGKKSA